MNETIEASKGLSSIKKDINELQIQLSSVKERQVESLNSNIRLQEKASEAYALSKESIALSKATSRETEAISKAVQSEVDTKLEALNDKLEVIKRATTNPLDRR
jgi:predicted RecB family endonuclease